jgi:hypothetical protein
VKANIRIWKWLIKLELKGKAYRLLPDLIGIHSETEDGLHILFLDFDNKTLHAVKQLCRKVQHDYTTGSFYIFLSSKGNYHAVCFDKMTFGRVCEIQHSLGMGKYIAFSALRGYWNLRVSPKASNIEYKCCIKEHIVCNASKAHYDMMSSLFPAMQKDMPDFLDNSQGIKMDIYTSVRK